MDSKVDDFGKVFVPLCNGVLDLLFLSEVRLKVCDVHFQADNAVLLVGDYFAASSTANIVFPFVAFR